MKYLTDIWTFLDGKKTIVGVSIHFVAYGFKGIGIIDQMTFDSLIGAGDFVMAGGLLHKGVKRFL